MNTVYRKNDITILNKNTLILGADYLLKSDIKQELEKSYSVIDTSYSFSAKTVGEAIEKNNFNLKYLESIKTKSIKELTFDEYYYLAIILLLDDNPKVVVIDNLFGYLNNRQKDSIINICKKNGIRLIVFDNELYYAYTGYEVIVIHKGKLAIKGDFKEVIKEEKILKRLGYKLPFYFDLSLQLKLYGLVGNACYSAEELEQELWN